MEKRIETFDDLFSAFGSLAKMARTLGHSRSSTAHSWKASGKIPKYRYYEILAAAKRAKVKVTEEDLDRVNGQNPG